MSNLQTYSHRIGDHDLGVYYKIETKKDKDTYYLGISGTYDGYDGLLFGVNYENGLLKNIEITADSMDEAIEVVEEFLNKVIEKIEDLVHNNYPFWISAIFKKDEIEENLIIDMVPDLRGALEHRGFEFILRSEKDSEGNIRLSSDLRKCPNNYEGKKVEDNGVNFDISAYSHLELEDKYSLEDNKMVFNIGEFNLVEEEISFDQFKNNIEDFKEKVRVETDEYIDSF